MPICYRVIRVIAICTLLTLALAPATFAQLTEQGTPVHGANLAIGMDGSIIAFGEGPFMSYSNNGIRAGSVWLSGLAIGVVCEGTTTYVVTNTGKLHIINASDPNNPTIIGSAVVTTADGQVDVEKAGNRVHITDSAGTLTTVDVTTPTSPTVLPTQANVGEKIEIKASIGYSLRGSDFLKWDIDLSGLWTVKGSVAVGIAYDFDISPDGQRAYLGGSGSLTAYDITAANPTSVGSLTTGTEVRGVRSGPLVGGVVIYDEDFVLEERKIKYIDTTDDLNLLITAEYMFPWMERAFRGLVTNPSISGRVAVAHERGYEALDASPPTFSKFDYRITGHIMRKAAFLTFSFLMAASEYGGFEVFDISNPLFPAFVAYYALGYAVQCVFAAIMPAGNFSLAAVSEFGLAVFNMGVPSAPFLEGSLFTGGFAHDVAFQCASAFMADGPLGLQVIDVSNPTFPATIKTVSLPGNSTALALTLTHAYVVTGSGGVRIIDITNPALAAEVGSLPLLTAVTQIATDGVFLYVGYGQDFEIYNLVDPTAPAFVSTTGLGVGADIRGITISTTGGAALRSETSALNTFAFIAAGPDSGLVVLDVTDPVAPSNAGTFNSIGSAEGVTVNDTDVFLSDGFGGLVSLQFTSPQTPVFVTSFSANTTDHGVQLAWNITADEGVGGFRIERSSGGLALPVHDEPLLDAGMRGYEDTDVLPGMRYEYTLIAVTDRGEEFRSQPATVRIPERATVFHPVHPNPFNPTATLTFELVRSEPVTLTIYDLSGARIVTLIDRPMGTGIKNVEWNGRDARGNPVSSGVYMARLRVGKTVMTRKAILLK